MTVLALSNESAYRIVYKYINDKQSIIPFLSFSVYSFPI